MAVATPAQSRLGKAPENAPQQPKLETEEPQLLTFDEPISAQGTDLYRYKILPILKIPGSLLNFGKNGFLVRQFSLNGSGQTLVMQLLRPTILHFPGYSALAGHPAEHPMYDTSQHKHYWPNMATNLYSTVRYCQNCPRIRTNLNHQGQPQLLSASDPLGFITVNIPATLSQTKSGRQFPIKFNYQYNKLTCTIQRPTILSDHVAHIFFHYSVISYKNPESLLSYNGQQLFRKVFILLRGYLGVKNIATIAYHP